MTSFLKESKLGVVVDASPGGDGQRWAEWLRRQLATHPTITTAAELVRASGTKPNGRPVINDSVVSKWLKGVRPSDENVRIVARALGVPEDNALQAAGYLRVTYDLAKDQVAITNTLPVPIENVRIDLDVEEITRYDRLMSPDERALFRRLLAIQTDLTPEQNYQYIVWRRAVIAAQAARDELEEPPQVRPKRKRRTN